CGRTASRVFSPGSASSPILPRWQPRCYKPGVSGRFDDRRVALAVRPIGGRLLRYAAGFDGAFVDSVDVRNIIVQPCRRRLVRPMGLTHLDDLFADPDLGMQDRAVRRLAVDTGLFGPESLLQKLDEPVGAAHV